MKVSGVAAQDILTTNNSILFSRFMKLCRNDDIVTFDGLGEGFPSKQI